MSSKLNVSSSSKGSSASRSGSNAQGQQTPGKSKRARKRAKQPTSSYSNSSPSGVAVSYSNAMVSRAPRVSEQGSGRARSCRIAHCELVNGAIPGSVAFTTQNSYSLNPGLAVSFPWLSTQAINWQQYTVHRLEAIWIPIASTGTQGDVLLSPEYDASNSAPINEQEAANNQGAVEDSCWKKIVCALDPRAMMGLGPRRFTRNSNVAGDIKTFDVANLFVCTVNETGTSTLGKLYFDYDVELFIPQTATSSIPIVPRSSALYHLDSADQTMATGSTNPIAYNIKDFDPLGFGPAVGGVFTPAAGIYRITVNSTFNDSSYEVFNAQQFFQKNGATIAGAQNFSTTYSTVFQYTTLMTESIVYFNGTDNFQCLVKLTGAAGTLVAKAGSCQLIAELA